MGNPNTKYYVVIGVFAAILLAIGVWCFTKKDKYEAVYDPLLEGATVHPDKRLLKFFEGIGADPIDKVNDQRYLLACQNCNRKNEHSTPSDCSKCTAFMSGVRRNFEGVL